MKLKGDMNPLAAGLLGGGLLCMLSALQKLVMGWPMHVVGFITPAVAGFLLASLLAWRQRKCVQLQRSLEMELGKHKDQLKDLAAFAGVALFQSNIDGTFRTVNDRALEIIGHSADELLSGRIGVQDLYADPLDREPLRAQLLEKGGVLDYHLRLRHKDGSDIWLATTVIRRQDEQGVYFDGIGIDITERREWEEKRQREEQKFRNFFEHASEGILFGDSSTRILEANSAAAQILGYDSPLELIGTLGQDMVHPEDKEACGVEENIRHAQQGEPVRLERRYRRADGSYIPVDVTIKCIGDTGLHHVIFHDITEQKLAEQALRESHATLVAVLESLPTHVYVADLENYEVIYLNKAMRRAFGEECLGQKCYEVFRGNGTPCLHCLNSRLVDEQGAPTGVVAWEDRNPLNGRWYLNYDQAVRWLDGRRVHIQVAMDINARKEAEEALVRSRAELEENKARLAMAMGMAKIVSWEMDVATQTFTFDDEFYSLYATSSEREGGPYMAAETYAMEFLHPEDTHLVGGEIAQLLETQDTQFSQRLEHRIVRRDGEVRTITVQYCLFWDEQGRPLKTVGVNQDITERKQAEEALRQSEQGYRDLFDNTPVGIFLTDSTGRALHVNPEMARILGADSPQDALDRFGDLSTTLYVHPERRDEFLELLKRDGQVRNFEYEANAVGGGRIWLSMNARIRDWREDGSFEIDGFTMDITERKRAEEALKASEQRFRNLLEDVDMVAVQGYDQERRVIFWNKASEILYGYSASEALGRNLEDLIIPESMREDVVQGIRNWLENGEPVPAGELELLRKDGSLVSVYSSHVMQATATGRKEMYCVDVDLSAIKRAHGELLRAKEQAEAASRAKSEFLANMSHEIRTPLNGILGMLQLLELTDMDQEQSECAVAAIQSTKRLNRLLSDILDISRVEAGKLVIRSEPFRVGETIHQVCDLFEPAVQQSGVELECVMDPAMPERLEGDSARLQQILSNLLGNAFKFTDHGKIRVEAQVLAQAQADAPDQCRVLFQVSDTGIGIPPEQVSKLFEAFTQLDEGMTRKYQGAGLGLAICKQLVTYMGGTISVDSEPGQGTTIHFCLPFQRVEGMEDEPVEKGSGFRVDIKRLLLAEDDRVNQLSVVRLLAKHGLEVVAVSSGEEALAALASSKFDAVLMDIQMPIMDGIKATQAIRDGLAGEGNRAIPIIALTAYAMAGDREKFLEAGMDGYLSKPVELQHLLAMLAEISTAG